jgi:hypothetical protein
MCNCMGKAGRQLEPCGLFLGRNPEDVRVMNTAVTDFKGYVPWFLSVLQIEIRFRFHFDIRMEFCPTTKTCNRSVKGTPRAKALPP